MAVRLPLVAPLTSIRAAGRQPLAHVPGRAWTCWISDARGVLVAGTPTELTRLEFDLLDTLSAQPRVAFSRRQLVERVWDEAWFGDDHIGDVHIVRLRRKLGDDDAHPRNVLTVRGVGYRMGPGT